MTTRILGEPPPPLEKLIKHAERFGPDGIVEAAIEIGYDVEDVVRVQVQVDRIEQQRDKAWYRKPRKTPEERVKKLMGIEDEDDGQEENEKPAES